MFVRKRKLLACLVIHIVTINVLPPKASHRTNYETISMKYGLFLTCGLVFSVKKHLGCNINLNYMGKLHGALKLREYHCEKEVYFSISLLIMKSQHIKISVLL